MTRRTVRALVKPAILVWARKSAGFTLDEVAGSSGLSKVADWESGELQPTIGQLRTLAQKYKRPLAVFYLQEKPKDFQVISDFRRLPGDGMRRMSPQLHLQIRAAQERREIALDLLEEVGEEVPQISISATLVDDPEKVGAKIRSYLGITDSEQRAWRDKREAFNGWRDFIEGVGVLVFQMDRVDSTDASGFALSEKKLPVIAVNRADIQSRRTFSLLHEFAHLLLSESGVSEFDIDVTRPPETQKVEVWCNAVAAATIFPTSMFLGEKVVQDRDSADPYWTEKHIEELALLFNMSKVSIVRRLLTLGLTNHTFYAVKEREYADQYVTFLKDKKAQSENREFSGRNMSREAISLLGKNFIRTVLAPYHSDRITLRDVSSYLNLKTRHIPKVEQALLSEAAR